MSVVAWIIVLIVVVVLAVIGLLIVAVPLGALVYMWRAIYPYLVRIGRWAANIRNLVPFLVIMIPLTILFLIAFALSLYFHLPFIVSLLFLLIGLVLLIVLLFPIVLAIVVWIVRAAHHWWPVVREKFWLLVNTLLIRSMPYMARTAEARERFRAAPKTLSRDSIMSGFGLEESIVILLPSMGKVMDARHRFENRLLIFLLPYMARGEEAIARFRAAPKKLSRDSIMSGFGLEEAIVILLPSMGKVMDARHRFENRLLIFLMPYMARAMEARMKQEASFRLRFMKIKWRALEVRDKVDGYTRKAISWLRHLLHLR